MSVFRDIEVLQNVKTPIECAVVLLSIVNQVDVICRCSIFNHLLNKM